MFEDYYDEEDYKYDEIEIARIENNDDFFIEIDESLDPLDYLDD